ncbi:MAG: GTP 3',8-cyclase MoaA [Deltaproteobacteria bacterium]|nr:GTP 3',8-cyclase MoaA [Deltaproteobacteria bacterium]
MSNASNNRADTLKDRFGRDLTYLRVSVTDRCNQRCAYCAPAEFKDRTEILSYGEITRIIKTLVTLGVKKVRLTGGEPLIRKDIEKLAAMLASLKGIEDLSLTTNAILLKQYAKPLKDAGLRRVNVSLDTLDAARFKSITGGGDLAKVLGGIDEALKQGLTPLKINTVIMKGFNEDELARIIDYARERDIWIRFIECMPMSDGFDWKAAYISVDDIIKRPDIMERVDTSAAPEKGRSAAYMLPLKSGSGKVGFISPMSNKFCDGCNRLRLTADGKLRACLPADSDVDLKDAIRAGADDSELVAMIRKAVLLKPESGEYNYENTGRDRSMIHIGG